MSNSSSSSRSEIQEKNWKKLPKEIRDKVLCEILNEENIDVLYSILGNHIKRCPKFNYLDWHRVSETKLSEVIPLTPDANPLFIQSHTNFQLCYYLFKNQNFSNNLIKNY